MKIFNDFISLKDVCIGMGLFDGVHLGHRELISQLVSTANKNNTKSVIITFNPSPAEKFITNVKYITTPQEKNKLISELGVDYLIELNFNEKLINTSAYTYIQTICKYFKPKYIFTGFNHTFGKNKEGNSSLLKELQNEYGFKYKEIQPVEFNNKTISSTIIKKLIKTGQIEMANKLLNSEYTISGTVQKGEHIASKIGFPTANIEYPDKKIELPYGVYSTKININNKYYKGIMNYGIKPTITNIHKPVAEAHIIDFDKNIYNTDISISILKKIRDERNFASVEELKKQIKKDIELC